MREPSIEAIAYAVARRYGLTMAQFKGHRRPLSIARPRQLAMYLCRSLTTASFPRIGQLFGGRDHSTVINACKAVRRRMAAEPNGEEAARVTELALLLVPHVERTEPAPDPFVAALVRAGVRAPDLLQQQTGQTTTTSGGVVRPATTAAPGTRALQPAADLAPDEGAEDRRADAPSSPMSPTRPVSSSAQGDLSKPVGAGASFGGSDAG